MKGNDMNQAQMEAANRFIGDIVMKNGGLPMEAPVQLPYGQLVRLVAWYGAVRFQAGRDGVGGTLEEPGQLEIANAEAVRP